MNNFTDILNKYSIQIPIIQRDYAQGREEKKVFEIRDTFLEAISDKLLANKNLHLDFVYGSIKNDCFIPLDGQQRLTTLFLLYLYFGKKENKNIVFLNKFNYETRASSREFCHKIVNNEMEFSNDNLSSSIENSKWFLAFWKNDPTIKSILVMLDSIHKKFKEDNFFDRLDNITFEFFELVKFGLDDDLYIKMNARGKPLTEFETFKAKFEQFLDKKDKQLQLEFSKKIDNDWTDFFWKYKDEKFLVDNAVMNYFRYITEMLYYKIYRDSRLLDELSFKTIEDIYGNLENVRFLFKSLDKLNDIVTSFDILFSKNEHQVGKITLFEKDINFLELVIKYGNIDRAFSIQKKFILFMIVSYLVDNDINDDFKDFIRVARNFVERIRNTKRRDLQYTPNFEYRELNKILNIFLKYLDKNMYQELLIESDDWQHKEFQQEIEKAKLISKDANFKSLIFELEDYKYLKGDIHNFLDDDINKVKLYSENLKEIFNSQNDSSIIRAMLSSGDSRFSKGGTRKVEARYFFGKNEFWEIFLTDTNPEKKLFFKQFVENYVVNGKDFNTIINSFVNNYQDMEKDWKYYFVKYENILQEDEGLSKDSNFFAWFNDFNIEKMGGLHLGAFHINPYIRTVSLKTTSTYAKTVKGEDESYLAIENDIDSIKSLNKNWTIKFSDKIDETIKQELIATFSLVADESNYVLNVNDSDRIELAVDFIKHLESCK